MIIEISEWTSMRVKRKNLDKLRSLGISGESPDDILERLMEGEE